MLWYKYILFRSDPFLQIFIPKNLKTVCFGGPGKVPEPHWLEAGTYEQFFQLRNNDFKSRKCK